MKKNEVLHITGTWLVSSVILPLYYYSGYSSLFSVWDLFYAVVLLSCAYGILYPLFKLIFKDPLIVTFFVYCLYGLSFYIFPFASYIRLNTSILNFLIPYKYLIVILMLYFVFIFLTWIKIKKYKLRRMGKVIEFVDITALLLFLSFLPKIILGKNINNKNQKITIKKTNPNPQINYPNIYHILLDAHANEKTIKMIGGDLIPFYQKLENLGFITYRDSKSNYYCTDLSVSSMLTMNYLPGNEAMIPYEELCALKDKICIFSHLSAKAYNTIKIDFTDNMVSFLYPAQFISKSDVGNSFIDFFNIIMRNSILRTIFAKCFENYFISVRKRIIQTMLTELQNASQQHGDMNCIFYSHIVSPHGPLIYGDDPQYLPVSLVPEIDFDDRTCKRILANTYVIDNKVMDTIQTILKQYENKYPKPIIVLHSDHGCFYGAVGLKERNPLVTKDTVYGNLLAIYMPDEWKNDAKDLTFINLYRFIFNHLFGDHYSYLEDKQIYKGKPSLLP